jgi:ELWxxDGT repeat protein
LLRELEPGPGGSYPRQFTASDDGLCAFVATTAANGSEIWRTDGTFAGTVLATELLAGAGDLQPENLTWFGNRHLFCQAFDPTTGREPYVVRNFNPATSGLLADVNPGFFSSLPTGTVGDRPLFQDSFGRLFLAADNGTLGRELYMITQGAWSKSIDRPCGTAGVRPRFASTPPVLGPGCTFSFRNVNPPAAAVYAILVTLGPPPAIDLGGGCRDHVTGGPWILLGPAAVPGPSWSAPVPLPADPALAGLPFAAQAIFAWATPIDAWSNAVWLQLGF